MSYLDATPRLRLAILLAGSALAGACGGSERASSGVDAGNGTDAGLHEAAPPRDDAAKSSHDSAPPEDTGPADTGKTMPPADGGTRYGSDGPDAYKTSAFKVTNGSRTFTVNVWVPSTPGPHPVVSFSPGLEQICAGYVPYGQRLASWGFLVLMRDDPGILVSGDTVASDLAYTVGTWLPAQNTMSGGPLDGEADLSHVGLAGHSRGGQTTLVTAEGGLKGKVQAWVGLDPVNTAYSAGTAPLGNLPSIGIPTLYIGAGVPTNCAPVGDNYETLYAASPSPSIALTVAYASHTQFEDESACSVCGAFVCSPMGTANSTTVLDDAMRYLTAYFARELLGDASVGKLLQGAGAKADEASGAITIVSK